ncbi:MAG TPA: HIT family protein [Kiritimatiellia bacterium]|jgi:histidine triad (HIT) family protein|nr:HIT family protein [Kiritimatiellia bacterium]OQC58025.1 MAG: HIT-like protein [Verrucomicrobia bacterium ADurb.Bin018]MBP9571885.1 HIT family protein [Kiritimatiellia bacterium]HOE00930.1 HIT family protein [Kiritimatiellia bacterium]HOE36624.1 HIT family protein [Kiritimatiellia bacterium]
MSNCIFCKIVAGTIPATKLYEDDDVLAFMDIGPIVKGHVLVIPKTHTETIGQTPPETLAKVIAVVRRMARAQQAGLGADGINIHQSNGAAAGQVVPHIHFHVIPRFKHDGHHWNWTAQSYADPSEVAALADRIKAALD